MKQVRKRNGCGRYEPGRLPRGWMPDALRRRAQVVVKAVAEEYGLTAPMITGRANRAPIVEARHVAMAICRNQLKMTCVQVGTYFRRDHGTVIYASKKIQGYIEADYYPQFKRRWPEIFGSVMSALRWHDENEKYAAEEVA